MYGYAVRCIKSQTIVLPGRFPLSLLTKDRNLKPCEKTYKLCGNGVQSVNGKGYNVEIERQYNPLTDRGGEKGVIF